jgi:lipopolysaccharide export system ATP-binding protein
MSGDIVFRADSICRSFGGRTVLNSATLWARSGRVGVLFGRNGSGKTTLFRIAAGLLSADQGVVLFRDRPWPRPRLHRLAGEGLFYLPERGLLVRNMSVRAHFDAVVHRFGNADALEAQLAELALHELLERAPDTLSGGERRRVEVALALVRSPVCLLADEPLMGIAPTDAELLVRAFRRLAARGCAVVVSGHEVESLLELADEVTWIVAGTTHGLGSAAQARLNWQFRREYLEGPTASQTARRAVRDVRDVREVRDGLRDVRAGPDTRAGPDMRDGLRDVRAGPDMRNGPDMRDGPDTRDVRDGRDVRESQSNEPC